MKARLPICVIIFFFFFIGSKLKAQTVSSNIMDANVNWQGGAGTLNVYLTDTFGLAGLKIKISTLSGIPANSDSLYYTKANGNYYNSVSTTSDNIQQTSIGNFNTGTTYYIKIDVLLTNGNKNEMQITTHN